MPRIARTAIFTACALFGAGLAHAQRGGNDWMTAGYDAQRSSWVRFDAKISPEGMSAPGFTLVWKYKINNKAKALNSLTPPSLLDFYIGYRGFRTLAFLGGSSGVVTAIDTDLSRLEWEDRFGAKASAASGSVACPGGATSTVTRPTTAGYPSGFGGRGAGRGSAAKSGVGEPFEGAITLLEVHHARTPPPPPRASRNGRRTAPPVNPYARAPLYVNFISADGMFHTMYVSNGEQPVPSVSFLPSNANAQGLTVVNGYAYVANVNGCGGDSGIWALDLESKKVTHWKSSDPGIAGSLGFAMGPDETVYAADGNTLLALEPETLKVKASYKHDKKITSSPTVFEHRDRDFIAITASDGELLVLDAASLNGSPVARASAVTSAGAPVGSLASWEGPDGTRWILAPTGKSIAALRLEDHDGSLSLRPAWVSRDLVSPATPAIVNGVVFALSSGEFRANDPKVTAAEREKRSSHAVLYALDGTTGKELWSSGNTISSFVTTGGLSAGGSRVYVGTHDGTLYAFGFPIEH